jgi:hypothetical protein
MKRMMGLLVGALGLAIAAAAPARAVSLDGIWIGYYGYDDGRASVKFQAKLRSDGGSLSGSTIEPNTFGDSSALFLTATLNGVINSDGSVHFIKTYDGTGGQHHSVDYSGVISSATRCIEGRWTLQGSAGSFRLCSNMAR